MAAVPEALASTSLNQNTDLFTGDLVLLRSSHWILRFYDDVAQWFGERASPWCNIGVLVRDPVLSDGTRTSGIFVVQSSPSSIVPIDDLLASHQGEVYVRRLSVSVTSKVITPSKITDFLHEVSKTTFPPQPDVLRTTIASMAGIKERPHLHPAIVGWFLRLMGMVDSEWDHMTCRVSDVVSDTTSLPWIVLNCYECEEAL